MIVKLVAPGRFHIAAIPKICRDQLIKDGFGYCVALDPPRLFRVEIIPDSEFYTHVREASNEEAKAWYESFNNIEGYIHCLNVVRGGEP